MNKEYIVVANLSLPNFTVVCNELIADGATPLGGLSTNHHGLYVQAFLKDKVVPKEAATKKRGRPRKVKE